MIDNSIMSFVSTVGFGGIAGFLLGFALKRIMKIHSISDITTYTDEDEGEEDRAEKAEDFGSITTGLTPLHPLALPKSVGISFVVSAKNSPIIDLCVTWARYKKEGTGWKRYPYYSILNGVDISANDDESKKERSEDPGIRIVRKIVKLDDRNWHVSIYLVNQTKFNKKFSPQTKDLVFQPQIRVNKGHDVEIEPLDAGKIEGKEEQQTQLLYRKLSGYARGHFCGATWKKIDPERPSNLNEKYSRLVSKDILDIPESDRHRFIVPDLRTEYLPSYVVNQSAVELKDLYGMREDLNADNLSQKWNPEMLAESLSKLFDLYGEWIRLAKDETNAEDQNLEPCYSDDRKIAEKNLKQCFLA